jgi:hypothetical protein
VYIEMRGIVFACLLGAIAAADSSATNFGTYLCNQEPECNGKWGCLNDVVPSYHPRYGMICQIENGAESFSVGLSEMCPLGGAIVDGLECQVVRPASSFGCPDFTETITSSTRNASDCIIKYPIFCPVGYAYFREYNSCKRFEKAICSNSTECGYYCRDGLMPVHLSSASDEYPVCLYTKYTPIANADGIVECKSGEVLFGGDCLGYYDALYKECPTVTPKPYEKPSPSSEPSREQPSKSPEPSREQSSKSPEPSREQPSKTPEPSREHPSKSPEPSREQSSKSPEPSREQPSKTPEPSREQPSKTPEPCPHPYCLAPLRLGTDGRCTDKQSVGNYAVCQEVSHTYMELYRKCAEWTMDTSFSDGGNCPAGFEIVNVQGRPICLRLYEPIWSPCPIEYLIQSIEGERFCEKVAAPLCDCPTPGNYTGCMKSTDHYDVIENMCYTWFEYTKDMTSCPPTYILVPRNDKLFCAQPYTPVQTFCPPGFDIITRADGTVICQQINGEQCDSVFPYEPSKTPSSTPKPVEPSQTAEPLSPSQSPVPSREQPSKTPEPSRDIPSKSPEPSRERPSETASPTPVTVPVITATIRIEISTNLVQNSTSDLTIFQEPAVLMSLKDAIARALGIPVDMVVIESVAWIDNGVVMSTVQIVNTTMGGRRLQAVDGFDIKYKVVNPPEELLSLPPEQFATRVEASTAVLAAAANAVSAATGVQVTANDIAVQSTEMAMLTPQTQASSNQASSLPIGAIAGGAGGGLVVLGSVVGIAVAMYYKKKRALKVNPVKAVLPTIATPVPENNFVVDRVTVMNPLRPGGGSEQKYIVHNKNFNITYSSKDIEAAFKPRQARRS